MEVTVGHLLSTKRKDTGYTRLDLVSKRAELLAQAGHMDMAEALLSPHLSTLEDEEWPLFSLPKASENYRREEMTVLDIALCLLAQGETLDDCRVK